MSKAEHQPTHTVRRRAVCAALLASPFAAKAQGAAEWPARPVRILLAYPPGGSTDVLARALAERLAAAFPGPGFVVDNRPGGAAVVGTQAAATAAPAAIASVRIMPKLSPPVFGAQ